MVFVQVLSLLLSLVTVEYGHAAYYAEGVMEEVIYVRQNCETWGSLPLEKPHVIGYVAVNDCGELGQFLWLCADFECWAGPYWIVDCRQTKHMAKAREQDIVVEVDYDAACRWGAKGYGPKHNFVAIVRVNHAEMSRFLVGGWDGSTNKNFGIWQ